MSNVALLWIFFCVRMGEFPQALAAAQAALEIHPGTGRLWAVFIQLSVEKGEKEQFEVFRRAIHAVLRPHLCL